MSESEKKETTAPSQQNPTEATKTDKFVEAVKEGDKEALKKAFDIIKDGTTARVDKAVLEHIAAIREWKLSVEYETIQQVNKKGLFNLEEFLDIIKLLEEPGEVDQTNKIGKKLSEAGDGKEIVLYGEEGVGKTWMAREVAAFAVRKEDFDVVIWLYLDRIYEGLSLHESIAYQLCVLAEFEESEAKKKKEKADEAKKKEPEKKDKVEVEEMMVKETKRKKKTMEILIKKALKGKKLLFIMDGQGSGMEAKVTIETKKTGQKEKDKSGNGQKGEERESEEKVEEKTEQGENIVEEKRGGKKVDQKEEEKEEKCVLELMAPGAVNVRVKLGCLKSYKSLMTREKLDEAGDDRIMVKPFTWKDSKSLASQVMEREKVDKSEEVEELVGYFIFRSERLPAQLLLISRIVSYFVKEESGLQKLRNDRELLKKGQGWKVLDVLIKGYERLPKSVLIDRYSPETPVEHFLRRVRKVSYNELICYWIMEGHLGHFDRVEEAYVEGHRVLMELMNCGLLQKQEGDYVVATTSGATKFKLDIDDYKDFFRGVRPGLAVTFNMRLGKVALADGMIKTVDRFIHDEKKDKKEEIISALLLDGNRIGETEPPARTLIKYKDHVEVLAISDPTTQHFELPILEMRKLRLLALRGCQFIGSLERFLPKESDEEDLKKPHDSNPEQTPKPDPNTATPPQKKLEGLTVLEISGRSSLESIPEKLFILTPNLKTLNLSYLLNIKLLPPSFYLLTQIEFLILRGCESLVELKSLKNFKDLKLLDVSEATNFEKFEDKSLHSNQKLQVLNLSKTKLKTLPLINQLKELKYVWLSDCAVLPRIRKIDRMENLQILDISGAAEVERFCDPSLEDLKSLVILDISRTAIKRLPANIGDPKYLYAEDCHKLRVVPPVEGLSKLEVVHLSGCDRLKDVRGEFFANVKGLRKLDLSKTRVEHLPFLSSLLSLRSLLLSGCVCLEKLAKLSCLKELEFLDLSGCKELKELEDGSFDEMIHLQHLYLSGTGLGGQEKPLPSLSKLESLKELFVRDCPNLTKLPGVEEVPNLEFLDYSGTVLESPPSFSNRDKPPRVDGAGIESINTSQLIKSLGASQKSVDQGAKWDFKYKEVSECEWNISNWRIEAATDEGKLGTHVYGVHFLRLLKEYPSFLTENLSTFRFLVYPSKVKFPEDFRGSYIDELNLRDIFFEQICEEKMQRCLEIREFNKLPTSLRPLIARAQFIVLVEDTFLKSLIDLGVDRSMAMKACWIESCNEMEHVVAAVETVKGVEKSGEAAKGEGDQHKKIAAEKSGEAAKSKGDQMKNAAAEKSVEAANNKDDQQKNAVEEKSGESAKSEGDQQKNGAEGKSGESAKSEGDQQKNAAAEEKSGESAKSEGDQQKNAAEEKLGESAKSEGDQQKNGAEEKSGELAKIEGDQPKNAAADNSGESAKDEGDQQKSDAVVAAAEKSGESAKSEGDQPKNVGADKSGEGAKSEGDQQKNAVADKSAEEAKSEGDQQNNVVADKSEESAKGKVDEQKNGATEKSQEQPKNLAEDLNNLETLWISDVLKLKSICKGDIQSASFKFLKSLYLEYCPQLSVICSSSLQLQTLETLYIKYCHRLEALFTNDNPSKMEKLRELQLWGLDSLKKIGCKAPFLLKLRVGECPLLEHVIASRLTEAEAEDTITERYENEGHENLDILHIKSCDKLKSIFESSQEGVHFERLTELELLGLPKLQKVARAAPVLRVLKVGDCPSLESIIAGADGVPNLETLEVKSCENMTTIIEGGQGGGSKLEKVKKVELMGLPELKNVGAPLPDRIEACKIWACPKMSKDARSRSVR